MLLATNFACNTQIVLTRPSSLDETASEEYQRHIDRQVQREVDMALMSVVGKYKFLGYVRVIWDVFMPILVGLSAIIVLIIKMVH